MMSRRPPRTQPDFPAAAVAAGQAGPGRAVNLFPPGTGAWLGSTAVRARGARRQEAEVDAMPGQPPDQQAREFAAAFRDFLEWVHSPAAGAGQDNEVSVLVRDF